MMSIERQIDDSIIHLLKLHWPTTEDLTQHIANKVQKTFPDAEITIDGVSARLETLQEELTVQQIQREQRTVWKICGDYTTIPNRVWNIITSLSKLECSLEHLVRTITLRHPEISADQVRNGVGILQSNGIIQVNNKIASPTNSEKLFLKEHSS